MATHSTTQGSLLETARALAPTLREHAMENERERRLAPAAAKALREAGMFRLCRPTALGGLAADPLTVLAVVEELSRADAASGWCAMIMGTGSSLESLLPPEAKAEIHGSTPDPLLACGGVLAPSGRAIEVEGGYKISGVWGMASGCHHADWLHAACLVFDEGAPGPRMGAQGPEWIVPYVRTAEVTILDTWDVSGLRGTGSHDFEMKDVFVPRNRTMRFPPSKPTAHQDDLYKFPTLSLLPMSVSAVALGIARRALDEFVQVAKAKTPFGMHTKLQTRPSAQIAISEAEALVRSGRALLFETASKMWDDALAGRPPTLETRTIARLSATNAALSSAKAVDLVYTAGGGSALYAKSLLQRCFRDVHAVTQNFVVAPPVHETVGKVLLDVEADTALF